MLGSPGSSNSLSPSRKGVSVTILYWIHPPTILSYTQPPQAPTGSVGFITSTGTNLKLDLEIPDGNIRQYPNMVIVNSVSQLVGIGQVNIVA